MDEKTIREMAKDCCNTHCDCEKCVSLHGDIYWQNVEDCQTYRVLKQLAERGYCKQQQGRWIYSNMGCVINCSNCGERLELCYPDGTEIRETAYCPFCGAKMDKQRDLTGGMRCRPIRVEVQNLVYLMGEWAIENNMCWNDEHAKNLAYYLLDKKYRKESDTAREILEMIDHIPTNEVNELNHLRLLKNAIAKRYGVEMTGDK